MDACTLNGEKYYYRNGKWMTSGMLTAPFGLWGKLNKLLEDNADYTSKSIDELLEIIDGARDAENYHVASVVLNAALEKADADEIRQLLPRLTSNLRKQNNPEKAIQEANKYMEMIGKKAYSPALFTSIAAAYCDLDDYKTGKEWANRARALSGGESSPELINVYSRIKYKS